MTTELKSAIIKNDSCSNKNRHVLPCLIAIFVFVWICKIYSAATIELLAEEAYYWTYSQHPSLSYFDHPPMVAWVISLGTSIFGNCEFGVRFGSLLLSLGSLLLMFFYSRFWFGFTNACWSAMLFSILPIYIGTGFLAFPDGPLIFFWLLTIYLFSKAATTGKTSYWALVGVSFGAALLSKYSAIFLGVGAILFLFGSRTHRYWLMRIEPWLSFVFAILVFSPVIDWNAQHGWVSFLFQASRPATPSPESLRYVYEFLLFQLGAVTPFILGLFVITAGYLVSRGWFWKKDHWNIAMAFFWPLFTLFLISALTTKVHFNWTAPAYLSLLPGAVQYFRIFVRKHQQQSCWRPIASIALFICGFLAVLMFSVLVLGEPKHLARGQVGGWRQLAVSVQHAEEELKAETGQTPFILGVDKLYYAAELGFYRGQPRNTVNWYALDQSGFGYTYWVDLRKYYGRPAVAVLSNRLALPVLKQYFNRLDIPSDIAIRFTGDKQRKFLVIKCFGYKGSITGLDRSYNSDAYSDKDSR